MLVDDHSHDGTAEVAREAARGREDRLTVVAARSLPGGWTGKLWALSEGVRQMASPPDLYLFTDADIAHHRSNLTELVARLEGEKRDLVSLMVKLHCESFSEKFLIPALRVLLRAALSIRLVERCAQATRRGGRAAAYWMRRSACERIGGYAAIKGKLIDVLRVWRAAVKTSGGSIWLGLTQGTNSLRLYPEIADIWNMVARTAYTQLDYSPLILTGTVLGPVVTYFDAGAAASSPAAKPPVARPGGTGLMMAAAYAPMLRSSIGRSPLWALLLPAAASVYLGATIASAWRHWRGARRRVEGAGCNGRVADGRDAVGQGARATRIFPWARSLFAADLRKRYPCLLSLRAQCRRYRRPTSGAGGDGTRSRRLDRMEAGARHGAPG